MHKNHLYTMAERFLWKAPGNPLWRNKCTSCMKTALSFRIISIWLKSHKQQKKRRKPVEWFSAPFLFFNIIRFDSDESVLIQIHSPVTFWHVRSFAALSGTVSMIWYTSSEYFFELSSPYFKAKKLSKGRKQQKKQEKTVLIPFFVRKQIQAHPADQRTGKDK